MTDYRRNFTAGCGFFFEWPQDVLQSDGFREGSTHPTGFGLSVSAVIRIVTVHLQPVGWVESDTHPVSRHHAGVLG